MAYRDADSTLIDLQKIRATVDASPFPSAEIHLTEWNSSPDPRDLVHDTAFMAPFVVMNNLKSTGLADSLVFWTFTDVFEEGRAGDTIFHGGFGMINGQGLKKASYYGYWFLARLGSQKLAAGKDFFVTRKGEKIQVLLWNYCHYNARFAAGDRGGLTEHARDGIFEDQPALEFAVQAAGANGAYKVSRFTFDRQHGSAFDAWLACGAPANPNADELAWLKRQAGPHLTTETVQAGGQMALSARVEPHGITLIEIEPI